MGWAPSEVKPGVVLEVEPTFVWGITYVVSGYSNREITWSVVQRRVVSLSMLWQGW